MPPEADSVVARAEIDAAEMVAGTVTSKKGEPFPSGARTNDEVYAALGTGTKPTAETAA